MEYVIFWLVLVAVLLIIEAATVGLTTIWFAGGALIAAVASFLGAGLIWQVALFLVISIGLLVFTRPWALRHLNKKVEKTNVDSLIGKTARVVEAIDNLQETGRVLVGGMEWTARSEEETQKFAKESIVCIKAVKGVKLIVAQRQDKE